VVENQQKSTHFSTGRRMRSIDWVQVSFMHKRIISTAKRVEFFTDRMRMVTCLHILTTF
jgi:hypothetical protein